MGSGFFSNQVGLEHAIMGYRLLPSDVSACPKLPQFSSAKDKLDMAHYVFIKGEPGCGKSITAYQLAFDYFQMGWSVYKLSFRKSENESIFHLIDSNSNIVFIIDDAQSVSDVLINHLLAEANGSKKLIVTRTEAYRTGEETVVLLQQQAVDAIYDYYLERKSDIIGLVKKLNKESGRCIGDEICETPFEFALRAAKREKTPWLFNYSLRGGWGNTKRCYELAREHDRADILLALISLKQILSLDKSVNIDWLYNAVLPFRYTSDWCNGRLDFLHRQNQITGLQEIRAIHMEMAVRIIARFLGTASTDELNVFYDLIRAEYLSPEVPLMGTVWLFNNLFSFDIMDRFHYTLFSGDFPQKFLERCLAQENSEGRMQAAHVLERMYAFKSRYSLLELANDNTTLKQWFEAVDSTTAYAYSQMLNAMNNEHKTTSRFVISLDLVRMMNQMKKVTNSSLYDWSSFLSRLSYFYRKKRIIRLANALPKYEIHQALFSADTEQLYGLFEMLYSLFYIDQKFSLDEFHALLPKIERALKDDFKRTIDCIELHFMWSVFGCDVLVRSYPNESQRKAASSFSKIVTPKMLAHYIETGASHDWHDFYCFWGLFSQYNHTIIEEVAALVDFSLLDKTTEELWEKQDGELVHMLYMLYDSNSSMVDEWIYSKRDIIGELQMPLIGLSIKTAEYVFNKGLPVFLIWDKYISWETGAKVVSMLREPYRAILRDTYPPINRSCHCNISKKWHREKERAFTHCLDGLLVCAAMRFLNIIGSLVGWQGFDPIEGSGWISCIGSLLGGAMFAVFALLPEKAAQWLSNKFNDNNIPVQIGLAAIAAFILNF